MQKLLHKLPRWIDRLNGWVGRLTAWLTVPLVLLVCFDVLARKVFNFSKIWIMDLEWHLFALLFLLAAGYALKHNRHVRVDLFYAKFSKKDKALVDFWGTLLFLIPWCVAVSVYAFGYARESFRLNEGATEPGGLPARYLIKFAMVAGILLLLLQAVALLLDSLFVLLKKGEPDSEIPGQL
jgi:TRAP-type mannitol/chloroaromatic compound transport system permease small subunit